MDSYKKVCILEAHRKSRTATLFNNLNWIHFCNKAYIKRCGPAYKRINGTLLNYLNASSVRTVKNWNNLSRSLKTKNSLKSFKAELWNIKLDSLKTKGSFKTN